MSEKSQTKIVADANSLSSAIINLEDSKGKGDVSIKNFLHLFSFLEAVCLYDNVTLQTISDIEPNTFNLINPVLMERKQGVSFDEQILSRIERAITNISLAFMNRSLLLKAFQKEGVIRCESINQMIKSSESIYKKPKHQLIQFKKLLEETEKLKGPNLEMKVNLILYGLFDFSYLPNYLEIQDLAAEATIINSISMQNSLQIAYDGLSSALKADIQQLRNLGRPTDVFIPPIPAIILDRVSSPKDIPEAALELRVELDSVRSAFRDYEITIRDDRVPLKESLSALHRLGEISKSLSTRYTSSDRLAVTEWRDVFDILPKNFDLAEIQEAKISKFLINKPLARLVSFLRNRNIIYLFRLREKFLNIKNYGKLISKVYGYELTEKDICEFEVQQGKVDKAIGIIGSG